MDDISTIITQQGEIARRRKLLEVLQGQNLQTPIVGGGKGNAIGQALTKVAHAYLTGRQGQQLAAQEAENRGQYQQALQGELSDYLTRRDGGPGQEMQGPMPPGQEDAQRPMMPGAPGNPREAVVRAMASQFPELQAIGKADFAGLRKEQMSAKDMAGLAEKFTPQSIAAYAQTGNPSVLRLNPKQHVVNNALVNADVYGESKPEELGYFGEKYGPDERVNGEIVQRELRSGKAHQVANRPASTNVSLNPVIKGEDAFATKLGGDVAGEFKAARDAALQGYNTKATLNQLRELESKGIFTGPMANAATTVAAIAQAFGVPVEQSKLANTEGYQQQIAGQIAKVLTSGGGVGRSMTDEDRKAFEKSLPTLLLSPQGRQFIFNQMERDSEIAIRRHQSMQQRLIDNPKYKDWAGMLTINPVDDAPGLGVSPPTGPAVPAVPKGTGTSPDAPMSLDDYINKARGGR